MRISRHSYPVRIDKEQLENVDCFNYLGSVITNDTRCVCEIKSRFAMAKSAFNTKKVLFTSKLNEKSSKETVKCYIWT
jgi:hypothetical protein